MFFRTKSSSKHTYLQLVEGFRQGKKVRQRVIATLGRLDQLQASGALDRLLQSGARLSEHSAVLSALPPPDDPGADSRTLGPALVFERLWRLTGCHDVVRQALAARSFRFDAERAVFLTVLHRLTAPGSDRSALAWMADQAFVGGALQLQHLYRAMAWLGQPLPDTDQQARTHAPRCVKDELEEALFDRRRDLFSGLDLVFFDTTSHYFHGAGGETLGRRGQSKDHRPQCRQMVLGLVLDNHGLPVCCELWPGNTADVTTLVPVAQRLQDRFGIRSVCLVADRGMLSQATMAAIEEQGWSYILGVRMRASKEFREEVLGADAPELAVAVERAHQPRRSLELKIQDVRVRAAGEGVDGERRYVVCRNAEQARRDRAVREEIVAQLRRQLGRGEKQLVGNRGYRRYLRKVVQPAPAPGGGAAGGVPGGLPGSGAGDAGAEPAGGRGVGAGRGPDRGRGAVRRSLGAAHEHGAAGAGSGLAIQAAMAGRAEFPEREVAVADAAGVPPPGRDDPGARVLFVPGAGAEGGVGAAPGGGGHRGGVGGLDAGSGPAAGDRGAVAGEALRGAQQGVRGGRASRAMRGSALAGDCATGGWGARRGRSGTHATRLKLSIAATARGSVQPGECCAKRPLRSRKRLSYKYFWNPGVEDESRNSLENGGPECYRAIRLSELRATAPQGHGGRLHGARNRNQTQRHRLNQNDRICPFR